MRFVLEGSLADWWCDQSTQAHPSLLQDLSLIWWYYTSKDVCICPWCEGGYFGLHEWAELMWWSVWIVHLPGSRINWKTDIWAYLWGAHLLVSQSTWEDPPWVWVHRKEDPRPHKIERARWEPPCWCGLFSTLHCRLDVPNYCKFLPPWQPLHDR